MQSEIPTPGPLLSLGVRFPAVTIYDPTGQPSVRIAADGKVWLAPGVTPDEAARSFWDAVERIGGGRLEEARREH